MKIGERIKILRESRNMSQHTLADLIHISPSYLSRIENNSSMPNIDCICDIYRALQYTPQDVLCDIFEYPDEITISDKIKILVEKFPTESQEILLETLELWHSHLFD